MRTLLAMCLFIAAAFTATAQKEADLIKWLNEESKNVDYKHSKSIDTEVGNVFSIDGDALTFTGNNIFSSRSKVVTVAFDQIDAIRYTSRFSDQHYVNIYVNRLTDGEQECIKLCFKKEKVGSKYFDKLFDLAKLKNSGISNVPAYMPTIKEITAHMNTHLRFIDAESYHSNIVPMAEGNEFEITDKHIRLFNTKSGKQQTILWSEIKDVEENLNWKQIVGSKMIGDKFEFIKSGESLWTPFKDALLTMEKTKKGLPATF